MIWITDETHEYQWVVFFILLLNIIIYLITVINLSIINVYGMCSYVDRCEYTWTSNFDEKKFTWIISDEVNEKGMNKLFRNMFFDVLIK